MALKKTICLGSVLEKENSPYGELTFEKIAKEILDNGLLCRLSGPSSGLERWRAGVEYHFQEI